MIELGPYLQRLEELNVAFPLSLIQQRMSSFALYHQLSFKEGLDRFVTEAEAVDSVIRRNHQAIISCGLGAKVLRAAYDFGAGDAFAERHLVIRDGWVVVSNEETKQGLHPNNPLSISNRHVLDEEYKYRAPYTHVIGRPNAMGELWLDVGVTVGDYDVVSAGFNRLRYLETSGSVTWLGTFMDCADIPANILNGFNAERDRYPVDYISVLGV